MTISPRAFFLLVFLAAVFRHTSVAEGLQLTYRTAERSYAVAPPGDGRVHVKDGDATIAPPEGGSWTLDGDVRTNVGLFRFSPPHSIFRRSEADVLADPARPFSSRVSVPRTNPLVAVNSGLGNGLISDWPEVERSDGIVVAVWIHDGRVTQAQPRSYRAEGTWDPLFFFKLSTDEAQGVAGLLFLAGGRWLPPVPVFADPQVNRAFQAMILDDVAVVAATVADKKMLAREVARTGVPFLHFAAGAGRTAVVDALLLADPKARPLRRGYAETPLHWAATEGRLETVRLLLKKGFRDRVNPDDGSTPFLAAVSAGHGETAKVLLDAGANPKVRTTSHRGPITEAIDKGFVDIVQWLYPKSGFDILADREAVLVLRNQARQGHTGMVKWLLAKGVSPDGRAPGLSALAHAAREGHAPVVAALLAAHADLECVDKHTGRTPLLFAASRGRVECAEIMLRAGADMKRYDNRGHTALHLAAAVDSAAMTEVLLTAGISPAEKGGGDLTAFDVALLAQNRRVADVLLAAGSRLDLKSPRLNLYLEAALYLDLPAAIERALEDGLPSNTTVDGWGLRAVARFMQATRCDEVLAKAGASEETPYELARGKDLDGTPTVAKAVRPTDPRDTEEEFEEQTVVVELILDGTGRVRFPKLITVPEKRLGLAVIDCLQHWRFTPPTKAGKPVATRIRLPLGFRSSAERPFPLGAVDEAPKPVSIVEPVYPRLARQLNREARVLVDYVITAEGIVKDVEVKEATDSACADAAVKALLQWKYSPAKFRGKAVAVSVTQPIIFNLVD